MDWKILISSAVIAAFVAAIANIVNTFLNYKASRNNRIQQTRFEKLYSLIEDLQKYDVDVNILKNTGAKHYNWQHICQTYVYYCKRYEIAKTIIDNKYIIEAEKVVECAGKQFNELPLDDDEADSIARDEFTKQTEKLVETLRAAIHNQLKDLIK